MLKYYVRIVQEKGIIKSGKDTYFRQHQVNWEACENSDDCKTLNY